MSFLNIPLIEPLQRALVEQNYTIPTPIQEETIPYVLAGQDVLGCAQTGTGKTAAFALPILQYLANTPKTRVRHRPRVLILAPTRELAGQIKISFDNYGKHLPMTSEVIFGGVSQLRQERGMLRGPDVVVATPGRLLDLMRSGHVVLQALEIFVLDEADRMLDMGFIHDVRKIIDKLPTKRQTLFFSATMPPTIVELSQKLLTNPKKVMVAPESTTAERISQELRFIPNAKKREALADILLQETKGLSLVFSATKHGANRIVDALTKAGVSAAAIHGNKSQGARERALGDFRDGRVRVLVATDIAARGIDVKGISLVVNYDLPREAECYVHRIGRTARAGAEGRAISLVGETDDILLRQIERTIRMKIPVTSGTPFGKSSPVTVDPDAGIETGRHRVGRPQPRSQGQGQGQGQGGGGQRQSQGQGRSGGQGQGQGSYGGNRRGSSQGQGQNAPQPRQPMAASFEYSPPTTFAGSSRYGSKEEPRFSSQKLPGPVTTTAAAPVAARAGRYGNRRFRSHASPHDS